MIGTGQNTGLQRIDRAVPRSRKPLRSSGTALVAMTLALLATLAGGLAAGSATAAPSNISFQIPLVTGPEIGPGSVPGGAFQTVTVTATAGERPGTATFAVPSPAAYYYQYSYRFLTLNWRNLQTGASGSADLRHWNRLSDLPATQFPATLPTSATVDTGPGPIFATITHKRTQYQAPPISTAVFPGAAVLVR